METKHFCNQKQFVTAYDAIRPRMRRLMAQHAGTFVTATRDEL